MFTMHKAIPQQDQRQDSLADQLRDLHVMAVRLGMYDAADWLRAQLAPSSGALRPAPSGGTSAARSPLAPALPADRAAHLPVRKSTR